MSRGQAGSLHLILEQRSKLEAKNLSSRPSITRRDPPVANTICDGPAQIHMEKHAIREW
jgi:hypothetical protein